MYFLFKSNRSFILVLVVLAYLALINFTPGKFPLFYANNQLNILSAIIANSLIIASGITFNIFVEKFRIIEKPSHAPAIVFGIVLVFAFYHIPTPLFTLISFSIVLAALFLLLNLESFRSNVGSLFNISLLIGIASIFYTPFSVQIIVPFLYLALFTKSGWRSYFNSILGFLIPWLFYWSYCFIWDKAFITYSCNIPWVLESNNPLQIAALGYTLLLSIIGMVKAIKGALKSTFHSKQSIAILIIASTAGILAAIVFWSRQALIMFIPIVAFSISKLLVDTKSNFWSEVLFSSFLLLLILSLI